MTTKVYKISCIICDMVSEMMSKNQPGCGLTAGLRDDSLSCPPPPNFVFLAIDGFELLVHVRKGGGARRQSELAG